MVVLIGKNLGDRQRELNYKVAEVIANKKDFNEIKVEEEITDVDKLYKIDIASQYKEIDYIIEILKSGDSLYISRALKCLWLFHDDYSKIISPENLHGNIFPFMSIKMKKKMLSTIAINVRNTERVANFFNYCNKNGMHNIALKFLIISTDEFKLNVLRDKNLFRLYDMENNLLNFVGNSFIIATAYIEMHTWQRRNIICNLRYLYAISSGKYLDILEKYETVDLENQNELTRLGIRASKDIMLKHKNRVLENPLLYVNKLNKSMLIKYSSKDEAEKYLISLFPKTVSKFWEIDFCTAYSYIINLIPINEQFEYVKQLFTTKYPGEPFETTLQFYKLKYYNMLSIDKREIWALRHIDEQSEILGSGNDFMWYKFVNIDRTLREINKYIMVTPDKDKRACIVNILIKAARDHKDLKKVLDYYYDRHVNENKNHKESFIDNLLSVHNVFEFNIDCWEALNKLFYSLDIYTVGKYTNKVFLAVATICYILHKIDMNQAIIDFIDLDVNFSYFSLLLDKLGMEKSEIVFQYLLKLFVDKLKPFEDDPYNKPLRKKLKKYVNNIFNLLACFQKDDKECPEIVKKFTDIHSPKPKESKLVNAKDIFTFIKTDATQAVDVLRHSDVNITECHEIVNKILRKLKVYFNNDIAQVYIQFLDRKIHKPLDTFDNYKLIHAAIFGIFHLGDESYKVKLMEQYRPSEPKINHSVIDRKLLCVQEAICRFMGYSRQPLPLKNVLQYIQGDYVHYCLPMFNMYLVNLPLPLVVKFTEEILNAPLSIQKHGLRLAFKTFTYESLVTLLLNTWKKSKNVSLRMIIYKSLFDKLTEHASSKDDDEDAKILYEPLKFFTSDLHQEDEDMLFDLICSCHRRLPNKLLNDYLQTAWHMVTKLPTKAGNIQRQINIIDYIAYNIKLVQRDFLRKCIIDEHIHEVLEQKRLRPDYSINSDCVKLWHAKWKLTANYIVQYNNNEETEESLALVSLIFKKCIEMWDDIHKDTYIFQKFYFDFIQYIENASFCIWYNNPKESCNVPIFKGILDMLLEALPLKEIYYIVWRLKLTIYFQISPYVTETAVHDRGENSKPMSYEEILSASVVNHIEIFVRELLVKKQFYPVYLPDIASLLNNKIRNVNDMNNLDIILSQSLANVGLKETHLLTLMILPTEIPEAMKKRHTQILQKIKIFDDDEIQSFLHFKFLATYKNALL